MSRWLCTRSGVECDCRGAQEYRVGVIQPDGSVVWGESFATEAAAQVEARRIRGVVAAAWVELEHG